MPPRILSPRMPAGQATTFQVDMQPVGRRVTVQAGETLLDAAQAAGVELSAVCGGAGLCGKCRVRLMAGRLSPPGEVELDFLSENEIAAGHRLACQCEPLSNVKLDLPPDSLLTAQRLQLEGHVDGEWGALDPVVVPVPVALDPPTLYDLRADTARLRAALVGGAQVACHPPLRIGLATLQDLSPQLRAQGWKALLAVSLGCTRDRRDGDLVAVLPEDSSLLGLAVDIGTTKLAAYLVDLKTGQTLAKAGATNPQVAYGEDVLSRIAYANAHTGSAAMAEGDGGRATLQRVLVERLNDLVADVCAQAGAQPVQIVEAVLVGNTAMHHLFAGLPVEQLGFVPYVPAVSESLSFPAREVGLGITPGGHVYLPPNIAGFVGADHVAMLVATQAWKSAKCVVAMDIGTNTEISLVAGGRLLACSCASGPAFEGAHIRDGMRAVPGAIERVKIQRHVVYAQTVGGAPAVGICGSGILDSVAEMYRNEILDRTGRFSLANAPLEFSRDGQAGEARSPEGHRHETGLARDRDMVAPIQPGAGGEPGGPEFTLVPAYRTGHGRAVGVTLKDVREIQLAKGAIRAGLEILLLEAGLEASAVDEFIIAGAFGTYLDIASAISIGMFPDLPLERFKQVGNAAGMGAQLMLTSLAKREEACQITGRVEYVELTTHPRFTRTFAHALRFP